MSTTTSAQIGKAKRPGVIARVWRETVRPFRSRTWRKWIRAGQANLQDFPFQLGTVEPLGLALLSRLVTQSRQYPGPIIEIGTLFGRTTTHMALFKAPEQQIITVDAYAWNPWQLSPECHYELTAWILHYLCQTEHVDQVRMTKQEFYATYRGPSPSLVFLDANHAFDDTRQSIEWAKSAGAAIVAGHDYADRFPGLQQAVREFGGPRELDGTVWVL